MALFRLLHASDLHIAQTPYWALPPISPWLTRLARLWKVPSHDPFVLKAFARWVGANQFDSQGRPQFDGLIITGDLATTGERPDLREAYDFIDAPPAVGAPFTPNGKPTLRGAVTQLDLLPGNHDRYRSAYTFYLPGGKQFDRVFCPGAMRGQPYWCQGQGYGQALTGAVAGKARLNVLKADFSLRSRDRGKRHYGLPGWLGQGRVLKSILFGKPGGPRGLVAETQMWRDYFIQQLNLTPVNIWAIHFDPFSTDELLKLLDSDLLVGAAKAAGVTAILCGHTHESKVKPLSDTTTVFACGTTTSAHSAQNDFQILEIEVPDGGKALPTFRVTWYRYDTPLGRFVRLATVTR